MEQPKKEVIGNLGALNDLRRQFNEELANAAASGDLSKAQALRTALEGKLELIRDELDPYELRLRKDIAKDRDFRYVGMFGPEGVARAQSQDNLWRYTDRDANHLPYFAQFPVFKSATPFKEGVGIAQSTENSKFMIVCLARFNPGIGYFDGRYDEVHQVSDGLILYRHDSNGKWNYMEKGGRQLNFREGSGFYEAGDFSSGLAKVKPFGTFPYHYIAKNGDEMFSGLQFWECTDFSEDYAFVFNNPAGANPPPFAEAGGYFLMDKNGSIDTAEPYDEAKPFKEGQAAVKKGDIWYYMSVPGSNVAPARGTYQVAGFFSEGLALVKNNGKQYFIDKEGKVALPLDYNLSFLAESFNEGVARINFIGREIYIDHNGREIKEFGDAGK